MRKWLVLGAVVLQVGVLAYMMGSRELILATGQTIVVRTAPIDPRDPFRGDFVRLRYAFNQANPSTVLGKPDPKTRRRASVSVYAVMRETVGGIHRFDRLSLEPPADGVFLKGKTRGRHGGRRRGNVPIRYGVEQLFVEQGKGKAIETRRGSRNGIQVPMEVTLAVSGNGTALIKDYDWSALGIKTEITVSGRERRRTRRNNRNNGPDQATSAPTQPERQSPVIKITLQNASDKPLSLRNPGDDCGFQLVHEDLGRGEMQIATNVCDETASDDSKPILLQPGEEYSREFDLAKPRWHLTTTAKDGTTKTGEAGVVAPREAFRFVYRALGKATSSVVDANRWLGELPSRSFRGTRLID